MKLAVTGITSKTGSAFFEVLKQNETEFLKKWDGLRLFFRSNKKCDYIDDYNGRISIEKVVGDMENEHCLLKLMEGCDTVLHITKILQSEKIMRAAIKQGVKRVIAVHTTGMYSKYKEAGEEYRRIEHEVKKLEKESGIGLTILRPTMIYGVPGDNNISTFIKLVDKFRFVPVINNAKYDLQPVHYKDLGKAYYTVLMNPEKTIGKSYDLSGEKPIQLREILFMIASGLNKKRKIVSCPYWVAFAGASLLRIVTFGRINIKEKVQRLCEDRAYSHDMATNDFGYNPRPFELGLKEEIQLYLKIK